MTNFLTIKNCLNAFIQKMCFLYKSHLKFPENYLRRISFVIKMRDASLQVYKKNHPPLCCFPSFFQSTSRLVLPKRL